MDTKQARHRRAWENVAEERRKLEARVAELEAENKKLRQGLSVASAFCDLRECKSCHKFFAMGYVCSCGRDNSYTDEEWRSALAGKEA